jgi:hypothetical protein
MKALTSSERRGCQYNYPRKTGSHQRERVQQAAVCSPRLFANRSCILFVFSILLAAAHPLPLIERVPGFGIEIIFDERLGKVLHLQEVSG